MSEFDEDFEQVNSGASLTYPTSAGNIKKNGHIVINGRPCKVVDYSTAKTGKHGSAKASIVGIDVFTGKKMEASIPTSLNVEVPNLKRVNYQIIAIDGENFCTLMDPNTGTTRSDLKLPEDTEDDAVLSQRIRDGLESGKDTFVDVLFSMDIEKIVECTIAQ
jgi:translation initiation factor 5A